MSNIFGSGYDPDFYSDEDDALDLDDKDFEFKDILNQLVEKEVQKRVQAKFNNFNLVIQQHDDLADEVERLKKEVRYVDRKREEASVEIYKTAKADGLREAFAGHAIGDKGFVIRYQYISGDCMDCKRKGRIVAIVNLNGTEQPTEVRCPTCDGTGRKSKREDVIAAAYIKQITSKIWNEGRSREIDLFVKPDGFDSFETSPDRFFKTEAEAAEALKIQQEKGKTK